MIRTAFVPLLLSGALFAQEWQLAPSDWVRYERRTVKLKEGKESFYGSKFVSVYGHDLRTGDRQFEPASPARSDLPAILALFLPRADAKSPAVNRRIKVRYVIELRCRGQVEIKGDRVACTWTFRSLGKAQKKDTHRISGGTAHVTGRFDAARGIFDSVRIDLRYQLKRLEPKPGKKPKPYKYEYEIRLKELHRHGGKGLRKRVNAAIDVGVKHLRTLQLEDGSYKPHGKWLVGSTALAVLTLAACDVPRTDPAIEKALAWMMTQDPRRTYALGLSLMAFQRAYQVGPARKRVAGTLPPDRLAWCRKMAVRLRGIALPPTNWVYRRHNGRYVAAPDASNTQYGVLGLRAAAQLGLAVPERTWLGIIKAFQRFREKPTRPVSLRLLHEGKGLSETETFRVVPAGFRYRVTHPRAWGSMTSAGIACLAIARHQLLLLKSGKLVETEVESMILGGWAWMDRHWGMDRNPYHHGGRWFYYYLYSLERAGILTRVKRVGDRDWYFEGAVQLLALQKKRKKEKDAYWGGKKDHIADTCFALLFLTRATAPLSGSRE